MSPRRKKGDEPPVRKDARGYCFIEWGGARHPLGKFGTEDYYLRKEAALREWREAEFGKPLQQARPGLTVYELVEAFMDHAQRYYVGPGLKQTSEVSAFRRALDPLQARCGDRPARLVGADDLKALQAFWVADQRARREINNRAGRVRRAFRWAVAEKLVPASVLADLETVRDLAESRTAARETEEVLPADEGDVLKTLPFLSRRLAAMALVQMHAGPRPGEVCRMKGCELFRDTVRVGKRTYSIRNWAFVPTRHKTKGKGKVVVYFLNAAARAAVEPFLTDDPEAYLFRPADDARENPTNRQRPFSPCYNVSRYGERVHIACLKAGVEPWTPNQLRHLWFSKADRIAGIETASQAGGHAKLDTTAIYVERRLREADALADRMG